MKLFDPKKLAKVELHVHLDTSLSYYCARQILPDLRLKTFNDTFIAPNKCKDLGDFLSKIAPTLDILQTKSAIALAVDDLFDQLKADHVIYAELRFAPLLHTRLGLTVEEVTETVLEAMQQASAVYNIKAGLLLCTLRHFSLEDSMKTAKLVTNFMNDGVVGLDLAADEARYSLDNHIAAFEHVRRMGGNVIAHAGEAKGADSVTEVLDKLSVTRIGHGVRSIENDAVVARLKQQNILLEVCPSSNIVCDVFENIEKHSVDKLKQAGVKLNINTDARTVANTTLNQEYQLLHDRLGWQNEDFIQTNIDALNAGFISTETREKLLQLVQIY
ncbi:adenosine deaminase [Acinetobacter sp. Ac_5812]|uniref:adenosine deaminase n=1 Tax=Acinetobacter sp. Ac_5812 TaxID=1848937 RepID=UPI00148F8633|nr:adenosine deaminase [Acinetobacter sp. Ac_5812]NNP69626.1 adenosine deaminase [Acinetobacter sp. Ac_5812]